MKLSPLSLYIHWPWCLKKCPYCDFNSHGIQNLSHGVPEDRYVRAIAESLRVQKDWAQGRPVETVFFGGGTPSLMSPASVEAILQCVDDVLGLSEKAEITLESNPGTFETDKFRGFACAGVNRISLGIQSFDDAKLKALGRVHNAQEARRAALEVSKIFDNFNLDLMFGLPGQDMEDLRHELDLIESLGSPHLSYYQLTLEPNTYFAKFPPPGIPSEDVLSDMTDFIEERTAGLGYEHYEVSAYAKSGHRCRHNLNYWSFGDYLAVGPGAHGKYTDKDAVFRFFQYRDPARWLKAVEEGDSGPAQLHRVEPEALPFEFMLNALRLREGVPFHFWQDRTGLPWSEVSEIWQDLQKQGLTEDISKGIRTTPTGWRFLNEVLEAFL